MTKLTESLKQFLFKHYKEKLGLIMLGKIELFTSDMKKEYIEWCKTEEGKRYLKGGILYKEPK